MAYTQIMKMSLLNEGDLMSITPLSPSIPVVVTSKQFAKAQCVGWIDYSPEHDLLWICALDADGTVWIVPNKEIRLQTNWSLGRKETKQLPEELRNISGDTPYATV